jgi:hypothetical protein
VGYYKTLSGSIVEAPKDGMFVDLEIIWKELVVP